MKNYKYRGITFNIILPKKIPSDMTGKKLFNEIIDEDTIALSLAMGSVEGEYKARDKIYDDLVIHIEYSINEEEYALVSGDVE